MNLQTKTLLNEIQLLKSQIKSKDNETVEDLLNEAANIMKHSFTEQAPIPETAASTWSNAARAYPYCKTIKKAFAADSLSAEDEKVAK